MRYWLWCLIYRPRVYYPFAYDENGRVVENMKETYRMFHPWRFRFLRACFLFGYASAHVRHFLLGDSVRFVKKRIQLLLLDIRLALRFLRNAPRFGVKPTITVMREAIKGVR